MNPSHESTASGDASIRPFPINIHEAALADLHRRLLATRWTTEYNWRTCEARLNALPQFVTRIDGIDIHFIHARSRHENALPLIMTHGWPGSVIELLGTIGPLTDPTSHGGSADDAFHLVLP